MKSITKERLEEKILKYENLGWEIQNKSDNFSINFAAYDKAGKFYDESELEEEKENIGELSKEGKSAQRYINLNKIHYKKYGNNWNENKLEKTVFKERGITIVGTNKNIGAFSEIFGEEMNDKDLREIECGGKNKSNTQIILLGAGEYDIGVGLEYARRLNESSGVIIIAGDNYENPKVYALDEIGRFEKERKEKIEDSLVIKKIERVNFPEIRYIKNTQPHDDSDYKYRKNDKNRFHKNPQRKLKTNFRKR